MKEETFWTWSKQEAPAREAFEKRYHKIAEQAKKGEVTIHEAYAFHTEERRFSAEYPTVVLMAVESKEWKKAFLEILWMVMTEKITKSELLDVARLSGGMKHYEAFKELQHVATVTKFPRTWEEEEAKEKEIIKRMTEVGKRRLGL
ncbi:MAG: hypothetical protein WC878_00545 [Candidatus Paceibacterota bacterium]|jgi:hypothetical protein